MTALPAGDRTLDALYGQLAAHISRHHRPLFSPEMPPALVGLIVEHLAAAGPNVVHLATASPRGSCPDRIS